MQPRLPPELTNIDVGKLAAELAVFGADAKYFDRYYDTIRTQYPDQFVAVHGQKVVGAADDVTALRVELEGQGFDPVKTYVRRTYFERPEPILILSAERVA